MHKSQEVLQEDHKVMIFKSRFSFLIWLYVQGMWSMCVAKAYTVDMKNRGYERKKAIVGKSHLHRHTYTQLWHWSLGVIDSFISLVQYANALLLAGTLSYCTPPLLPQRSRARWELAKWYSCLFRCAAQQTQDVTLQLHCRCEIMGLNPIF